MDIRIRGKKNKVPKSVKELAIAKYGHLDHYLSTIESVEVELYEDGKGPNTHVAHVRVATSGPVFRAQAEEPSYEKAIDSTLRKLQRQVKEFKRKRSGRPAHSRPKVQSADNLEVTNPVEPAEEG
jgi:ribosomal subunit interface protein